MHGNSIKLFIVRPERFEGWKGITRLAWRWSTLGQWDLPVIGVLMALLEPLVELDLKGFLGHQVCQVPERNEGFPGIPGQPGLPGKGGVPGLRGMIYYWITINIILSFYTLLSSSALSVCAQVQAISIDDGEMPYRHNAIICGYLKQDFTNWMLFLTPELHFNRLLRQAGWHCRGRSIRLCSQLAE